MDLSDLPESALRLIAEAEIEAKYILRKSKASSLYGTLAPELDCVQAALGPPDELSEGRKQAVLHLFDAVAGPLWERVQPDLDAFEAKLDEARKWVNDKFHTDAAVLSDAVANRLQWARHQVAAKPAVQEPQKRSQVGALRAGMIRRRQALKEGRLEGYIELPSAAQKFAPLFPRGLSGIGEASTVEPLVKTIKSPRTKSPARKGGRPVILVDGERIKELRGERSQAVFARSCRISVDAVQRAERHGRSSEKTIRKIVRRLRGQGQIITKKDLIKNTPQ